MPKNAQKWGIYKDGIKVLANFGLECGQMPSRHFIGFRMIKQDHLAGKLSARHHVPHLVAEPLRLLARRGVVVQPLLDHPVPGGDGDYHHDDGRDDIDVDFLGAEEVSLFLTVNK